MREIIGRLIEQDEESLLIELGKELSGIGAVDSDDKDLKERGLLWFRNKRSEFKNHICKKDIILKFNKIDDNKNKRIQIIMGIADVIAPFVGIVPVFLVSTLIFKEGIDSLCNDGEEIKQ